MRHTTKAMLAVFVASLMIFSAVAVLFADDGSATIQPIPEKTDGTVKVLKNGTGISLELPKNSETGNDIKGITTNGVDTVTINGSYFDTTAANAFYVGPGMDRLNIVVVGNDPENPNAFTCKSNEDNVSGMIFKSPVRITGTSEKYMQDVLSLKCTGSNVVIGIDKNMDLAIENVALGITIGSGGSACNKEYGITDDGGRLDIKLANVSVSCSGCNGDVFGMTVDTMYTGYVSVSANCLVKHMVGVTLNEKMEEHSRISTNYANVNGANNYSIGIMTKNPNVKITDSIIRQQFSYGYSNNGAVSFGFYLEGLPTTPIINNSNVYLYGDTGVACYGSLEDPQPFDTSTLFSSNTIVNGSKNSGIIQEWPDSISGEIGFEYKNIKTSLKHQVIYDLNGAEGTAQTDCVENGEEFTVKDINVTRDGYSFVGWTDGENIYMPGTVLTMSGYDDIVLKAVWNDNHANNTPIIVICAMFALLLIVGLVFYYGRRTS